jgi:hypothetical protein
MARKLYLQDHLIVPFGRPKWEIENIRISKVTPNGTYLEGKIPFAYIDKNAGKALQIADFWDVVPDNFVGSFKRVSPHFDRSEYDFDDISNNAVREFGHRFQIIYTYLKTRCELGSNYESKFLDIYFDYWSDKAWEHGPSIFSLQEQLRPLLPLPQAHLYLEDDLLACKTHMQKVDFAFWTGHRIVAIEIDSDNKQLPDVVRRDRRYRDSGIEVIHILNSEIEEFMSSIMNLLPQELNSQNFVQTLPSRSPFLIGFDDDSDLI